MRSTTDIKAAADVIREDGVIAYPTETLPGLGCLASSQAAVKKLLEIKKRTAEKGLILLASKLEQLEPWIAPLDTKQRQKLRLPSTTPTTWLVPAANKKTNPLVQGKHDKLAIRITTHPVARELCDLTGEAIISTSANLAGDPAALQLDEISPAILEQLDLILIGPEGTRKPSKIRDLISDQVIRG